MKLNTAYRYTVALMLLMCAVLAFGSCAASLMDEDKAEVKKDKEPKKEAQKEAPTTETPTTEKPTTEKPTTEAPTTEAPKKETQNETKEVIVNDADIKSHRQFLIQPVGVFRPPMMRNQGGGREESGGDTLLTGLGDQRAGQVCFPGADIAVEDQITTGVEEVQTAQLIPTVAGREADVGPVVTVEGLDHG